MQAPQLQLHDLAHFCDDAIGTDCDIISDMNGADNLCAGADVYIVSDNWIALIWSSIFLANSNKLRNVAVITNYGLVRYYYSHGVTKI